MLKYHRALAQQTTVSMYKHETFEGIMLHLDVLCDAGSQEASFSLVTSAGERQREAAHGHSLALIVYKELCHSPSNKCAAFLVPILRSHLKERNRNCTLTSKMHHSKSPITSLHNKSHERTLASSKFKKYGHSNMSKSRSTPLIIQ